MDVVESMTTLNTLLNAVARDWVFSSASPSCLAGAGEDDTGTA
jgi:hypothetical protein